MFIIPNRQTVCLPNHAMATLWWILANTLLPIFLPFMVLWPWRLAKGSKRFDDEIAKNTSCGAAVKNGQFCLIAIAMCVSNLHEVLATPGALSDWIVVLAVLQGAIGALSLLVYTLAMAFDTDVDLSKRGWAWFRHYRSGAFSLTICAVVGTFAVANHLGLAARSS